MLSTTTKNLRNKWVMAVFLAVFMSSLAAPAQITFTFIYTDAAGTGFNSSGQLGVDRKAALAQAGVLLSDLFPTYTATITMLVDGTESDDSTVATAASAFTSTEAVACTAGYNRGDIGIKILGGTDPSPGIADGTISVNFEDFIWDLDDVVDPAQLDFKSIMLHQFLHAVGFASSVTEAGADRCGNTEPMAGGWNPFDEFLANTVGNFINGSWVMDTASWDVAVIGGTGNSGILWLGPNATAANGGNPVPLYTPTTYNDGSSISHLDDDFFTTQDLLMEANPVFGPGPRTLSAIATGMLRDIGFVNAVPVELTSFSVD